MFDEQRSGIEVDDGVYGNGAAHVGEGWREIDRRVRRLAGRRAGLDAEEARLLIAAKAAEVHRHLGYGSFDEYLERVLGYAPTTGRDRMRVAAALEALPATAAALAAGTVTFSAVREITRVATAETERAWLEEIDGLTVREIEGCVRGRALGDRPEDRPDPAVEPRMVRLELPPDVYALFLEARRALEGEAGQSMTDAEFVAVACRGVLGSDGGPNEAGPSGARPSNAPPHQIAFTVCVDCKRGWQDAAGRPIEVAAAVIEQAQCDAAALGRVDGAAPEAVQRSIPAAVRRMVLARDHHRCQVPGCRSARFVDVHHLHRRADGGDHRPSNCVSICSLHHRQVHLGRIVIDGVAGDLRVRHADGRPYGAPPPIAPKRRSSAVEVEGDVAGRAAESSRAPGAPVESTTVRADAYAGLVAMGFRPQEARTAVAAAVTHVGDGPIEVLLRAALRACAQPTMST